MHYIYGSWQFVNVQKRNQGRTIRKWTSWKIIALFVEVKCSLSFNANSEGSKLRSKSPPKSGFQQVRDSASMSDTENAANMFRIHIVLIEACSYFHSYMVFK